MKFNGHKWFSVGKGNLSRTQIADGDVRPSLKTWIYLRAGKKH